MDGHHGGTSRPSGGFTLLELLVALAILGILFTLTIPRWGNLLPVFRLNGAARQIHSELHNLRAKAAAENVSFQLVYSGDSPQYTAQRDGASLGTRTLPQGTVILRRGRIAFSPRGTARAGRVRLRNDRGVCSQVIVSPTGRIRICKPKNCNQNC